MVSNGILPLQGAFLAPLQQFPVLSRHIPMSPSYQEDLGIGAAEVRLAIGWDVCCPSMMATNLARLLAFYPLSR